MAPNRCSAGAACGYHALGAAACDCCACPGLRYWRTERALLQRELADRAGVNRTTVQRAEDASQPHAIRLDMVRKLAEALGVEPGDLMREPPER